MCSSTASSFCCDPSSSTALRTGPGSGSLAIISSLGSPSPPTSASTPPESFSAGDLRSVGSSQSQPPSSPLQAGSSAAGASKSTSKTVAHKSKAVRQGLLEREGFAVVGEASNGVEAVRLTRHFRPEVAILDFDMPLMNGIDAVTEIVRHSPGTRTILLTADTGHQRLPEALRAGSRGFVLKNHGVAHLIRAIREVTRGGVYVSPSVSTTVAPASLAKTDFPLDRLTRRERQVLQLIAEGKKTKEIAALLGVKIKTAESHRTRIMRRVNIHETAELA